MMKLWIVNRADDSMVIVHNTRTKPVLQERLDSHRNHFMEEGLDSIAFGAYDSEFDFTFATGQNQ